MDFVVPVDYRMKVKQSEEILLDLARKLKKIVEHKGNGDTNCCCAFGTVKKGSEKSQEELEIRGRIETLQTTALLRMTRIHRRILDF